MHQFRFDQPPIRSTSIRDELKFPSALEGIDGSTFSLPDLRKLYDKTVNIELEVSRFVYWSRQARGAAVALQHGERKLQKIEAAERQFDGLP